MAASFNKHRVELATLLCLAAPRKQALTEGELSKRVGGLLTPEKTRMREAAEDVLAAISRLEKRGEVTRDRSRLSLSDKGQGRCTKQLGVKFPNRSPWRTLKRRLIAHALVPPSQFDDGLKRVSDTGDLAGLVLHHRERLTTPRIPTGTQAADALAWRELGGDPKVKPSWPAARRLLLGRMLGVLASTSDDVLLRTLAARVLGATNATRAALEAQLLSQWSTAEEQAAKGEQGAESFAAEVLDAASDPRTKRFGDHKAFIASVFETYKTTHKGQDWEKFGRRLLDAHLRGSVRLARADLVPAMDRQLVDRSELTYENATFHFLELP